MRVTLSIVIVATVGAALPVNARAQAPPSALVFEAGAWHAYDESLLQLGVRATPTHGGFTTVDLAFATFPDLLFDGVMQFQMDVDVTHGAPRDTSSVCVFPRAGFSLLTAGSISSSGSGGSAIGYNAGIGLFFRTSSHVGIRLDYTYRRFLAVDGSFSSITAGLVFGR